MKAETKAAKKAILAALEEGVGESGRAVQKEWRERVAYDEGDYYDAIGVKQEGLMVRVGVFDKEVQGYAHFPEFGTEKQPAQPAALPAAEQERTRLVKRLTAKVERAVK